MSIMDINNNNYKENVLDNKGMVLVKFWAPWCTYCRRLDPAFQKTAQSYEGQVLVGQVNIDEAGEIARENNIEVIPTLVLYKDGARVDHVVNPGSKAEIDAFIKKNL